MTAMDLTSSIFGIDKKYAKCEAAIIQSISGSTEWQQEMELLSENKLQPIEISENHYL
jgi:hypothetical protein